MNDRDLNPAYYDTLAAARGITPAPARSWSILLTSANHGTVGPLGSTFPHAGEHHERVKVVEIVEAGAPPAPGTDLAGLVRLPLTNEQIAAGAIVRCDHGGSIGRNGAIEVWDAMISAAPVAAQAGQVTVPEWRGIKAVLANLIAVAGVRIADKDEEDDQLIADAQEAVRQLDARLAAAPSAPAVVQQAPADLRDVTAVKRMSDQGLHLRFTSARACSEFERSAQASTAGERQPEGGA